MGGEIGAGWAEGRPGSGGRGSGSDSDREEEEKDGEEGEEEEGEEEENGDAVELPTFSSSGEEEALAMPDAAAEDGGGQWTASQAGCWTRMPWRRSWPRRPQAPRSPRKPG